MINKKGPPTFVVPPNGRNKTIKIQAFEKALDENPEVYQALVDFYPIEYFATSFPDPDSHARESNSNGSNSSSNSVSTPNRTASSSSSSSTQNQSISASATLSVPDSISVKAVKDHLNQNFANVVDVVQKQDKEIRRLNYKILGFKEQIRALSIDNQLKIEPSLEALGEVIYNKGFNFGQVDPAKLVLLNEVMALFFSKAPASVEDNHDINQDMPLSREDHPRDGFCGNGLFFRTVDERAREVNHQYIEDVLNHVKTYLFHLNPVTQRRTEIDRLTLLLEKEKRMREELELKLAQQGTSVDPVVVDEDVKPKVALLPWQLLR